MSTASRNCRRRTSRQVRKRSHGRTGPTRARGHRNRQSPLRRDSSRTRSCGHWRSCRSLGCRCLLQVQGCWVRTRGSCLQGDSRHLRRPASRRTGNSPKHCAPSRFDRTAEYAPACQGDIRRALGRSWRRLTVRGAFRIGWLQWSARSASSSRRLVSRKCCADASSTSARTAIRRRRAARGSSAKKLRNSLSEADRSASSKWAENMPSWK